MPDQTVNIPLLRKAVEWAEVEAAKPVERSQWFQSAYVVAPLHILRTPECGTCYCIAGYVASLVSPGFESNPFDAPDIACEALGIDPNSNGRFDLFEGTNSIEDVRRIAEGIAGERL